jgi:CubicO group peptidase (beta-lactamase class C family)
MQLAGNGKVSLNATIANAFLTLSDTNAISVGQLLQHRSGLPNHIGQSEPENRHRKPPV